MTSLTVNDNRPRASFVQTVAGTSSFDLPFQTLSGADVKVSIEDGPVNAESFTVEITDDQGSARLHLGSAPALGARVNVWRDMPVERTANFLDDGSFRAAALNLQLNKLTLLLQQVEALAGDALRKSVADEDIELTLPGADTRAGKYLAFDDDGKPIVGANVDPVTLIYLGAHADQPETRNDGSPLQAGDLYFDTAGKRMRVYAGTPPAWVGVALVDSDFLSRAGTAGNPMTGGLDMGGHALNNVSIDTTGRANFRADGQNDPNYHSDFYANDPSRVVSRRRASAGQTADIDHWSASSGAVLARITNIGIFDPIAGTVHRKASAIVVNTQFGPTDAGKIFVVQGGANLMTLPPASSVPDGWHVTFVCETGNNVTIDSASGSDTFAERTGGPMTYQFVVHGNGARFGDCYEFIKFGGNSWFVLERRREIKSRMLQHKHASISIASYSGGPWQSTGLAVGLTTLSDNSNLIAQAWGTVGMQAVGGGAGITFGFAYNGNGGPNSHDGFGHAQSQGSSAGAFDSNTAHFTAYKVNPPERPGPGGSDTLTLWGGHIRGNYPWYFGRPHIYSTNSSPNSGYGLAAAAHMQVMEIVYE